jgi:uncharacterized membrane protein YoaK (UPF0700 family)
VTPESIRHPLTRALLALTFTTGLVDAASYLGLGKVFTANMTGNVVLLGFGVAGAGGLPVVAPLISLGAFLVGSAGGGLLASRIADRRRAHLGYALGIEVSLLVAAAILAVTFGAHRSALQRDVVITLLAVAMGVRNATSRRIGIPDLTTTVLTGTLTNLAADLPVFGGSGRGTPRQLSAVLAMLSGAVVGALLVKSELYLPLALAAVLAVGALLGYEAAQSADT